MPARAVDWLAEGGHTVVLDVGAGTGRFTAQLLALKRFPRVHAVEPDQRMLAPLHRHCPEALAVAGTAERIPLAEDTVDAVFAAGAWHWFNTAAALADIARVLRPAGVLGVVWNIRDRSVPWIRQVDTMVGRHHAPGQEPGTFTLPLDAPFTTPDTLVLDWEWEVSPRDFVVSLGTYSHLLDLPPREQAHVVDTVEDFLTTHPELVRDDLLRVPITTTCYRTRLTPRRPVTPPASAPARQRTTPRS